MKILTETSKLCLKIKAKKTYKRIKKSSNKKWFDCECRLKRHELRKVSNEKHRDPLNSEVRERYHKTLNDYKKLLDTKKKQKNITTQWTSFKSWQGVILELFKFDERNSQQKCSCPISGESWLHHFKSLPSIDPTNSTHEHEIHRELNSLEHEKEQFTHFDYEITEREIRQAGGEIEK